MEPHFIDTSRVVHHAIWPDQRSTSHGINLRILVLADVKELDTNLVQTSPVKSFFWTTVSLSLYIKFAMDLKSFLSPSPEEHLTRNLSTSTDNLNFSPLFNPNLGSNLNPLPSRNFNLNTLLPRSIKFINAYL